MYIFGGSTGTAVNDFYELNMGKCLLNSAMDSRLLSDHADTDDVHHPDTNAWQPVQYNGQPPGQRFCHVGTVYDSNLIVFGGYDGSNRLNDFKQFRFADEEFELDIPESTLITDLRALVNTELLSDVTFVGGLLDCVFNSQAWTNDLWHLVEGIPVYGHKILCIRCNYFKAMLTGEVWN